VSYTPALYQCVCGKAFTSKALAVLHTATATSGNHLIKRVR
jgi:hypothetical protein